MKKFLCAIAALSLFSTAGLKADEGMWMLPLLEKMNIKVMQQEGCRLTAEQADTPASSSSALWSMTT